MQIMKKTIIIINVDFAKKGTESVAAVWYNEATHLSKKQLKKLSANFKK